MVLTLPGRDVFAGYTPLGAARSIDPAQAVTWATEMEQLLGLAGYTASARLGQFYIIPNNTVAEINVPADAATVQAAIDGTMMWYRGVGGRIRIKVTGHLSTTVAGSFNRADGMPIDVVGATAPVDLTFVSFDSPTGTKGNRSIGINVGTGQGASVAVGDVINARNFAQSFPDSGSKALISGMPSGAFMYAYNALGDANLLASWSGTTITFNQAIDSTKCPIGTIFIGQGQVRYISARPTTTTATVSTAFDNVQSNFVYGALAKAEAGTVSGSPSASTTVVTGTSTAFTSVATAGDVMVVCDVDQALVMSAVASATSATCENARTFTGKNYAIINRCWELETALLVTAVAGDKVTVRHESWAATNLPFRNLTPGSLRCIKDVINATDNGFIFAGGGVTIDKLALVGNSLGAGLDGSQAVNAGIISITQDVSVIGFNYGAHFENGMTLKASGASFHGASASGLYFTHGATLEGDAIRSHAAGSYSLLIDLGGNAYISRYRFCCSREDAIRGEVGGSIYADWGVACSNGGRAFQLIGKFVYHIVGAMVGYNGGEYAGGGLDLQNGAGGRSEGMFAFCNYGNAISSPTGHSTAAYLLAMGNLYSAIEVSSGGNITADLLGCTGAEYYALVGRGGTVTAPNSYIRRNKGGAISYKMTDIDLQGSYIGGNTGSGQNDIDVYAGSKTYIQGITGSPVQNIATNEFGDGGALIFNDAKPILEPVRYRTGDQTTRITISTSASLFTGTASTILNGVTSGETTTYFVNGNTVDGTRYIRFDFGADTLITEATWYQSNSVTHGVWKWQGSDNTTNWTDIGSSFTLGGSAQVQTELNGNRNKWRYYQLVGVSGTTSGSPYLQEVQFKR